MHVSELETHISELETHVSGTEFSCKSMGDGQGIWLEKLRNWGGVEDERDGLGGFALIGLKPTR